MLYITTHPFYSLSGNLDFVRFLCILSLIFFSCLACVCVCVAEGGWGGNVGWVEGTLITCLLLFQLQRQITTDGNVYPSLHTDVFKVNGSRLLVSDASLDYETAPVINVTLNATDSGSPAYSVQVCNEFSAPTR